MKRMLSAIALLCVAALLFTMSAFAQTTTTGSIVGRAQDSTGAVIPGVEVSVSSPSMIGGSKSFVTDEQGVYRFELLPPGNYKITFTLPGFKTLNYTDITVTPNLTMTQNGAMEVSATSEEVTVTSQAPAIDLEAATVGVNWSQKLIDELPWSRSLTGISQMIPATYATSYDIGNSNFGTSSTIAARSGGRSGGGNYMVDGLMWCQTYSDFGTFEEMAISTNAKGADQVNSGITISTVSKSGSNQFHGNASMNYQNGSMQSVNIDTTDIADGVAPGTNKFTHFTDYFGDIGGPVKKDKLWFYAALRQGYQGSFIPGFNTAVGGGPSVFNTVLRGPTAKLTYQLTSKMKIDAYWGLPDKHQPYRGGGALNPAEASQNQDSWSAQGPVVTWTDIIDSKTTAQVRIARGGYWWPAYAYSMPDGLGPTIAMCNNGGTPLTAASASGVGGACAAGLTFGRIPTLSIFGVPNVGVHISDTTSGAVDGGYDSNYTRPIRWQWNGDFSRVMSIGGKANEVKVGYMGWWDSSYAIDFRYAYQQAYIYKSATGETCPNTVICNTYFQHPYEVTLTDTPNNNQQGGKYEAWYINDKITVNRKLTLNVGLRFDWSGSFLAPQGNDGNGPWATAYQIPYDGYDNKGNLYTFPTYHLWSPRVSFAYDVTGNGRLAVKASYGRYYGITSSPNSQPGPGANSSGIDPISTRSCTYNNWDGSIPYNPHPDFGPDGIMGTADDIGLTAACPGSGNNGTHSFAASLRPSYLDEFAGGVEMGLSRNYSIRVNFQRKFDYPNRTEAFDNAKPFSAYTAQTCLTDPGPSQVSGVGPGSEGSFCTWAVPNTGNTVGQPANPNFATTNITYINTQPGEGVAAYTSYDFTFNKAYANKWSFLTGFNIDLGHPGAINPLTPNTLEQESANLIPTWSRAFHMNGVYELPAIPLFGHQKFGGLQWSSTFTKQSGDWLGRSLQITDANKSKQTILVDGHYQRYPSVADWDQRITKKFRIKDRDTIELRWDLYNTMNANTVTAYQTTTSNTSTWLQANGTPLQYKTVLTPRIMEYGASFKF